MATMSFLFVDQVGSTEQLARLGDTDARPVRQALFDLLTTQVEGHGGDVVDNTGDGVMAVFDGATDAVHAGVGMQQAAVRHNRRTAEGQELHLRVGIHTGEVARDEQGRWFGMPVVVAARLCARADADAVWSTELVVALAGSTTDWTFEELGPLDLKGVGAPVVAVAVGWEEPEVGIDIPARLEAARRTPLAGREEVLETMREAWQATSDGSRAMLLLAGEAGIGKSRMAAEIAHEAAASGATVIEGSCDEQLPAPFRPFVLAVRHLAGTMAPDEIAAAIGNAPSALARVVPGLRADAPGPFTDPRAERLALFEELDALLAGVGGANGTLLVLDDLQWADEGTFQLVGYLAGSQREGRLLVVGTYRESDLEPGHPLEDLLADLWRTDVAARVILDGLDGPGVQRQMAELTDADAPPLDVAEALAAATSGNPFFVEEVVRQLIETDGVPGSDEAWRNVDVAALPVLDRVRDVVRRRVGRLGDATIEMLPLAAVMGREFSLTVIDGLERSHGDDVLDLAERAARSRLVDESPDDPDRYRFRHALIQQALYEELSAGRRIRLHRAIAEAMDRLGGHDPSEVAHHWRLGAGAAGHVRAIEAAEHAGAAAMEGLAFERAQGELGSALDQLARVAPEDGRWRGRLLVRLGEALAAQATDRVAITAAFEEAGACARRVGDGVTLAQAALGLAGGPDTMIQGEVHPVDMLEGALDSLPSSESAMRARVMAALAAALSATTGESGEIQAELEGRSERLAAEGLELARAVGESDAIGFALRARLRVSRDPLTVREQLTMAEEVRALGVANEDRSLECWGLLSKSRPLLSLGQRASSLSCLDEAEAIVADLKQPAPTWLLASRRVALDLLDGDFATAEERCDGYLAEFGETSFGMDVHYVWANQQFLIRYLQGRLHELGPMLEFIPPSDSRSALEALVMARDQREAAGRKLDEIVARLDDVLRLQLTRSALLVMLTQVACVTHWTSAAPALQTAMRPYLETITVMPPASGSLGHMALYGGLLDELAGDRGSAVALVRRALAANREAENQPMTAMAQFHLGRQLLADAAPEGAAMLREARERTVTMGMAGVTDDIDALLGGVADDPSRPPT